MSSSSIKLQTLIRKFKNTTKEQTSTLHDFAHELNIDMVLDTISIFQSKTKNDNIYNLIPCNTYIDLNKKNQMPLPIDIKQSNYSLKPIDIKQYIDIKSESLNTKKGYLSIVYNAELADEEWLITIKIMDMIYANFITLDKVKLKSLHIGCMPSTLSAINHFMHNSSLKDLIGAEWEWLSTINREEINKNTLYKIKKQYKSNMLYLLENTTYSVNNINYTINEVTEKLNRVNFITGHILCNNIKDFITYAIFSIKLMQMNSVLFIKLENIENWNTNVINALLLYSLIFEEIFIFKFDLITDSTFLLCKNKKKISNESLYKKLVHLLSNKDFTSEYNLFSKNIFEIPEIESWLDKIKNIINSDENSITFDNIQLVVSESLNLNSIPFLL